MPWVKIDDRLLTHPKVAPLTDAATALWLRGLVYCAHDLTDGRIPAVVAGRLGTRRAARELVHAKLWLVARDRSYLVHDYLRYQPSRAAVLELRARYAARGRAGAEARWHGSQACLAAETDSSQACLTAENDSGQACPVDPVVPEVPEDPVKKDPAAASGAPVSPEVAARLDLGRLKMALADTLPAWPAGRRAARRRP